MIEALRFATVTVLHHMHHGDQAGRADESEEQRVEADLGDAACGRIDVESIEGEPAEQCAGDPEAAIALPALDAKGPDAAQLADQRAQNEPHKHIDHSLLSLVGQASST